MSRDQIAQTLLAPWHTLSTYNLTKFRRDALAGLTVAVLDVPQAMAYAVIAGVPPQYGLYTAIIQGLIGALFASNGHLATGPTNTQSLLIAATVARAVQQLGGQHDPALYLQLVFGLSLVKGLIQIVFAIAKTGDLVRYVSRSVIVGFAAGAGVLIAIGQLPNFLGVSPATFTTSYLPGALGAAHELVTHLHEVNPRSIVLGVVSLLVIFAMRYVSRLVPGPLLAVLIGAVVVVVCGWSDAQLPLVGEVPRVLPAFHVPQLRWHQVELLMGGALALALLGMIETVAIGKRIASETNDRIDANREFLVQGAANVVGAFLQNIPGSGSFTRSALNLSAGGMTRFAGVFNAVFVALILLLLAPQAKHIPLSTLAAVLFVVAYSLIDWRYLFTAMRASRSDAMVCFVTFFAALLAPLQYAIYIGVFMNLALYLREASRLHIAEMIRTEGGFFRERPVHTPRDGERVVFLQIEGDLFFGVADELQDRLNTLTTRDVHVVIFRLKRTHAIDSTILSVLEHFTILMKQRGGHVIFCGLKPDLMRMLRNAGLLRLIGEDNVFEAAEGVFTSAKQALERAQVLVNDAVDASEIDDLDDDEQWAYEI